MDIPFIIDKIFKQLLGSSPKYDPEFVNIKFFCQKLKLTYELKTSYNLDFFEENTPDYELLSHIIFSKLPPTLQKELIQKVDSNYPKISQIFDSYKVIKTLIKTGFKKNFNSHQTNFKSRKRNYNKNNNAKKNVPTLENLATKSNQITRHCRFCSINGHTMNHCSKYSSLELRRSRCREMGLCLFCTSASHRTEDCYGKANKLPQKCAICKSRGHVTPLCDKAEESVNSSTASTHVCTDTGTQEQPYILPIVAITVSF